jgi:dTDP-4-amino-4,6-dideoxygalactose transaminase
MIVNDEMRARVLAVLESGVSYGGEDTQRFETELARYAGKRYGVTANPSGSVRDSAATVVRYADWGVGFASRCGTPASSVTD